MFTGILGSGFGLYGYLPAVLNAEEKVYLLESARPTFEKRLELSRYAHRVIWVEDKVKLFKIVDVLIVCVPPQAQELYLNEILCYENIKFLILEKPLCPDPKDSKLMVYRLLMSDKIFRIGYTFLYTEWFSKIGNIADRMGTMEITWHFKAHHFLNNIDTWKRCTNRGGGVIRFYGIHVMALLVSLGYNSVSQSTTLNYSQDTDFNWNAVFVNLDGNRAVLELNSNSDRRFYQINMYKENRKSESDSIFCFSNSSPFDTNEGNDSLEDNRVGVLTKLYLSLFDLNRNYDLYSFYRCINDMWTSVENINEKIIL